MGVRRVPASVGQRLLWQMDHHRGANGSMNCPLLLRLRGPLEISRLCEAVEALTVRHEALRTTFEGGGRRLTQIVHDEPLPVPFDVVDLIGAPNLDAATEDAVVQDVRRRIDPEGVPLRVTVWRRGDGDHVACVTMHHLVTDGWSCAVVAHDLAVLYGGAVLPPVGWQYAQWVGWQEARLRDEALARLKAHWLGRLEGARLPALPRVEGAPGVAERTTAVERASLGAEVVERLQQLARARGTALFTVMLSLYYLLLRRITGQADLAVASIFANRTRPELRDTVGFLSNMVVLRTTVPAGGIFDDLIRATSATVIDAFAHQELPYHMLPLGTLTRDGVRPDDVVFQMFTGPMASAHAAGVEFEPMITVPPGIGSRWEFELSVAPDGRGLAVLLCYAQERFDAAWARAFIDGYVALAGETAATSASSAALLP